MKFVRKLEGKDYSRGVTIKVHIIELHSTGIVSIFMIGKD